MFKEVNLSRKEFNLIICFQSSFTFVFPHRVDRDASKQENDQKVRPRSRM